MWMSLRRVPKAEAGSSFEKGLRPFWRNNPPKVIQAFFRKKQ
jgi:hypothetical protein